MKNKSAQKVQLTTYEDLCGGNEMAPDGAVISIPITLLHPFKGHPFRVADDGKMEETVESVKRYGVLVPGIVREHPEGGYEIISGHRRKRACELAGLGEMPAIVRELDDDEATVVMVDSNIQREDILPSEKARAYKMKYEAMKHQGSRGGKHTADEVGEAAGESGRTVQRYIRLAELAQELLDGVDRNRIPVVVGEKLSFLSAKEQGWVAEAIRASGAVPSKAQAGQLKSLSETGGLTEDKVYAVLAKKAGTGMGAVTIPAKKISALFPAAYTKVQIEEIIYGLLEEWKKKEDGEG